MPSPTAAIDLITRSMKLAKLISGTETPKADEASDALATLNDVLENWDTQPTALLLNTPPAIFQPSTTGTSCFVRSNWRGVASITSDAGQACIKRVAAKDLV